jgi:putative membrane protein
MRKLLSMATVVATVLFLPALASAQDATKLPAADMDFVNQATAAGMAEVDLGKLGAEKAADQSVKQFAQRMVDDHSKANEQLIKILADKKIEVPKELPADAASTKDQLSSLPVADFDSEYMTHMVSDHEKAVALFDKESKEGQDAQLKQFAEQTLPTIQDHLKQAQQIQSSLGKVAATGQSPEHQTAPAAGTSSQTSSAGTTQEAARPANPLGEMTANDLLGQKVVNKNGDKVGKIDDIVLNSNDKAVLAVISVGGFLGIGDKLVAIPVRPASAWRGQGHPPVVGDRGRAEVDARVREGSAGIFGLSARSPDRQRCDPVERFLNSGGLPRRDPPDGRPSTAAS